MVLSSKSLAGPGYIILNVLRAMNIISLVAVVAAHIILLLKLKIVTNFFVLEAAGNVVCIIVCLFLVATETPLFRAYFRRNWPLFTSSHGFVSLGLAMIGLGVHTLGNLNRDSKSQGELGTAFWRLVIGPGILVFTLGFVNIILSYIFRNRHLRITARKVRAHGAVAVPCLDEESQKVFNYTKSPDSSGAPSLARSVISTPSTSKPAKKGFLASMNPFKSSHDQEPSLPRHHHFNGDDEKSASKVPWKKQGGGSGSPRPALVISGPMNMNPQFGHLIKPESAHHKAGSPAGLGLDTSHL